jgi:hypothetical protein
MVDNTAEKLDQAGSDTKKYNKRLYQVGSKWYKNKAAADKEASKSANDNAKRKRPIIVNKAADDNAEERASSQAEKKPKKPSRLKKYAAAGALAAGAGAVGSFKNRGFFLFLAAGIVFFVTQFFGIPKWYALISLFFMIYSTLFIFKKNGTFAVSLFIIWYFFFGSANLVSIKFYIIPIVAGAAILHGISSVLRGEESFVIGATEEMIVGVAHILVFFLDVGLVQWLAQEFGVILPTFVQGMLNWIPLWMFIGLFVMFNDDEKKTWLTKLLALAAILYLVAVIFFISPDVAVEELTALLPGPEELVAAKEASQKNVNPAWITVKCMTTDLTNTKVCIEREKELYIYKTACEEKGVKEKTEAFIRCIEEEKENAKNQAGFVEGAVSDIIKQVTKIHFVVSSTRITTTKPRAFFPGTLVIENPREQEIKVKASCSFKKLKEVIPGEIYVRSEQQTDFVVKDFREEIPMQCKPTQDLDGSYQLEFKAELFGLRTPSFLKRAFFSKTDSFDLNEKTEDEINEDHFRSSKDKTSQAPKELARINFWFGTTEKMAIIPNDEIITFNSWVENTAVSSGKILRINGYYFNLLEEGFSVKSGDEDCLQGFENTVSETRKTFLSSCFLELPSELQNIKEGRFDVETFIAELNYDYEIKKTLSVTADVPVKTEEGFV